MRGKSFTVNFNDYTAILGTNGAGKGTVLEAMSWVLTGSSIYGDKTSLFSKGDSFTSVTAFLLKDGKQFEVTRELKKTSSGASSQIRIDHKESTQGDIESLLGTSQKCIKSAIFPRTFITSEKTDKMKVLLSLTDELLDGTTKQVPFTEYASVIKEYKDMATSAQGMYNHLNEEIAEAKAFQLKFESYDDIVAKKFFGSVSDFVSDAIQKIFNDYKSTGNFDFDELAALRKYLEIGSAEEVSKQVQELEKVQDGAYDVIDAAAKSLAKTNHTVMAELGKIANVFKTYGIEVEIISDKDKISIASVSYNGIQLAALSGKEQVETAAAVHNAICSLLDTELPIFIENGESVVGEDTLMDILSGINQSIVCYVSDTPLAIDNGDGATCTAIHTNKVVNRSKLWQVRIVNFV